MVMQMYAIYDSVSLLFSNPVFAVNSSTAIRELIMALAEPTCGWTKKAKDCVFYHIGSYDELTGVLVPLSPFPNLGRLSEWVPESSKVVPLVPPPIA